MNLLQSAMMTIFAASNTALLYCLRFHRLNEKFRSLIQQHKQKIRSCSCSNDDQCCFSRVRFWQLQFIYSEHYRLCGYLIRTDREKWSTALCQFLMVGIPMNVCFMCVLIFGHPGQNERLLYIFVTVIHVFSSILPTATLAHVSYYIDRIHPYIPKCIPYVSHLRLKLKFDDFYGQLMQGEHCCFTFGYFGGVTYTTLSKVCFGHSSFSLFFSIFEFFDRLSLLILEYSFW
ncbi:hypothetical protein BLA29_006201 [Euroglyphus maynei]|uniref:Uncharacterized protein n=1 Tax=Euroglyphus maynei TaxID=6958 RepID=A0A1Y3B8M0_EURMA|nr:hypothetical protein BLA29_006201 [Euroglyphus maynei]